MFLATPHGRRQLRSAQFGNADRIPMPSEAGGVWSSAGKMVSTEAAMGLPAVMAAIRLKAETLGSLPLIVYTGDSDEKERAPDAPQWELLHDQPNPDMTPFEAWSYVSASMEGWGGAFVMKAKGLLRGSKDVLALTPMDPARVTPRMLNGELVFDVWNSDRGSIETLSKSDIIYIPGLLVAHPKIGISPIAAHREALGGALALEEYGNRHFANSAVPSLVIKSDAANRTQRAEAKESWENAHKGSRYSQGTAVLPPGWDVTRLGLSPADSQFIEGQKWSVDQVARIFKIMPAQMIGGTDFNPRATPEQRNQDFLQFTMTSTLVRVEQRLHADDDLFPDKSYRPMFLADGLLRADMASRYAAYVQGRQGGFLSVNDIRRKEGLPEIEGGDVYQTTPVGGAPNLQPGAPPEESDTVEPAEPST